MSDEWFLRCMDDIAEVIDPHPSHRAPAVVTDGIPFVGIGDFSAAGTPDFSRARRVGTEILGEHRIRYSLEDGLVALGRVASIGKVVVLPKDVEPYAVSPTMALLRAKPDVASFDFLPYLLQGPQAQSELSERARGTTRRSVGMKEIRKISLLIPPLPVQRRIVDLLTHLDAHIANLQAEQAAAIALLDSLRLSFLGNLVLKRNLENVVTTARAGGTPDRKKLDFYGGDIPWLKSGEVGGSTIWGTDESITIDGLNNSSAWFVPAETTLVAMYGATAGVVGYTAIPLTTNQAVLALVGDPQLADSRFLFHWMTFLSPNLKAASTGAAQANLSKQVILRESGFPDLKVEEQSQIAVLLDSAVNINRCLEVERLRLTEVRKCLLTSLLSGIHGLDDAYDSLLNEVA